MSTVEMLQSYGEIGENPILLERDVTVPVAEGLAVAYASFMALYLQYQKHHFVVEGSEYYMLHEYFSESYEAVQEHAHDLGERLHGLGGVPPAGFATLAELCCFSPEMEGAYRCRTMIEHDLAAEQEMVKLLRRQASMAESVGDRATRYLLEQILLKTEERAYHLEHFLTPDSLKVSW